MGAISNRFITRGLLVTVTLLFALAAAAVILEQWRVAGVVACVSGVGLAGLVLQVGRTLHRALSLHAHKAAATERGTQGSLNALHVDLEHIKKAGIDSRRQVSNSLSSIAAVSEAVVVLSQEVRRIPETVELESQAAAGRISAVSSRVLEVGQALDDNQAAVRRLARSQQSRDAQLHSAVLTDIQAVLQLQERFMPKAPLPVAGGWAISPTGVMWLVDLISRHSPQRIVECGSGTSTLWMALALRQQGSGSILTLEHQEAYAAATRGTLARHGLSDLAEVRQANLADVETPLGTRLWYDIGSGIDGPIDLVVVDGPPKSTGPLARYPVLPELRPFLADGAIIVVDDAQRPDEQEMCEHWLRDYPELERLAHAAEDVHVFRWRVTTS